MQIMVLEVVLVIMVIIYVIYQFGFNILTCSEMISLEQFKLECAGN